MLGLTYLAEHLKSLSLVSMLGQIWALPFIVYLNAVDTSTVNKWVMFAIITLLLGNPTCGFQTITFLEMARNAN